MSVPAFPPPPGAAPQNGEAGYATPQQHHQQPPFIPQAPPTGIATTFPPHTMPEEQHRDVYASIPADNGISDMSPATAERERAAEEAIMESIEHVVTEYVRQDIMEKLGVTQPQQKEELGAPAAGTIEFTPGPCLHNTKIGLLFACVAFGLLPMMSTISFSIALIGAVAVYIADYLNYRHGSIVIMCLSLASFGLSLWLINLSAVWNSSGGFMMLANVALLLIIVLCWALMQYRWIQVTFPELTVFLERFVLGVAPVLSLPSLFSTTLAFCGARNGTIIFAVLVCVIHYTFYCRLPSSFKVMVGADINRPENFATGKVEARTFSLLTLFFPFATYLVVQSNWVPESIGFHFLNMLGLIGIGGAYIFHDPKMTLWFMFPYGETLMEQIKNDPLDFWHGIQSGRKLITGLAAIVILHWGVYRLLHSRYSYLFLGLPSPYNIIILCIASYTLLFVVYASYQMIKADSEDKDTKSEKFSMMRVLVLVLSVVGALLLAIVVGMPPFFLPMSALAASTFNAYLLDRRQVNSFFMFICSSSMLMLWWMYKTFSYVIVDLKVLNDSIVPTPLLAVSMLWAYIVGCLCFQMSFTVNKSMFKAMLAMWALKIGWIEHVLYSQHEVNTYPAFLVAITTGCGIFVVCRLYKNDVVDGNFFTGLVVGLWAAKLVTFFQEVTQGYYIGDYAADFSKGATALRAAEVAVGNVAAAVAVAAFFTLETEKIEKKRRSESSMLLTFVGATFVAVASSRRNAVRAAFDALSHFGTDFTVARQIGLILAITALLCIPIVIRHGLRFTTVQTFVTSLLLGGTALFLADPLVEAIVDPDDDDGDLSFMRAKPWARILLVIAAGLLVIGRFVPFAKKELPAALRIIYWSIFSVLASAAIGGMLLPSVNLHVMVALCCFISLSVVVLDVCHYTHCEQYVAWILYAASVLSMVVTYVTLNAVDLSSFTTNDVYIYEAHTSSRLSLLSLTFCVNFAMGVVLKFRLSGASLFPKPKPLNHHIVQQVGLVCNYCVLLGTITGFIITYYNAEGNPLLYIACALMLMLLHDDQILFFDLHREYFRYFPALAAMLIMLWYTQLQEANLYLQAKGLSDATRQMLPALFVLPSHISVASLLYFGKKKGGIVKGTVFAFVGLDLLVLLLTSMPVVRWMAMVGVCSQIARLFAAEFWKRNNATLL